MSYPKKNVQAKTKPVIGTGSQKLDQAKRERLLAIQQREQLKGMLVSKFIEKYGKKTGSYTNDIIREVETFMRGEKLTEENLRKLERKIKDGKAGQKTPAQSEHQPDNLSQAQKEENIPDNVSVRSQKSQKSQRSQKSLRSQASQPQRDDLDDLMSVTSSQRPRSVYELGDEDDEWATMMKYDTELAKKEAQIEKMRAQEQKLKVRRELDEQLRQKNYVKQQEQADLMNYMDVFTQNLKNYDERQAAKERERKEKIMAEKRSRDKQLHDEKMRKKLEAKTEKEMDGMLVKKIQNEIDNEIKKAQITRLEQKETLRHMLIDNEDRRIRLQQEAQRLKDEEVEAQREYTRLVEKQEAERAAEMKAREDRAKAFMNHMADTVIKDQKDQILDEERTLLRHGLEREQREIQDDRMRLERIRQQKKDIRNFLNKQLAEKEAKKEFETQMEKRQAEIWKKDTQDFYSNEEKKKRDLLAMNKKHAEYLMEQCELERKRRFKKMTPQELLFNKDKLKNIAENEEAPDNEKFRKTAVSGH